MRTTRRLREFDYTRSFVFASLALSGLVIVNCSGGSEDNPSPPAADASTPDASENSPQTQPADAGSGPSRDASQRDLFASDAGPAPVTCTESPCAIALVTTVTRQGGGPAGFCVLLDDGTVACWGQNRDGQLGRGPGNTVNSAVAQRVVGLTKIRHLDHTCAIDDDGATWCWGAGPFLRSANAAFTTERSPVKLDIPPATAMSFFIFGNPAVAVGCALVDTGVLCWGANGFGQVRVPVPGESATAPTPATLVATPDGAPFKGISVGYASFALRSDGTLLSWGRTPPLGRMSSLFPDPYPKPIPLTGEAGVSYLDVANDNACAVVQGNVYCWGAVFGDRTVTDLSRALPALIETPEPAVSVATTSSYGNANYPERGCVCGVSGSVYCWGNNASGQVGDGTYEYAHKPARVMNLPAPASVVRTMPGATCALLTTGKVYCWGENSTGELGNGFIGDPSNVPIEVALPAN